jgi:hypothetical protein
VFISSGDDARDLRERIRGLIDDVFNQVLTEGRRGVVLYADMWERTAPQRAGEAGVNEMFVQRARDSHLTMVTLIDELRPGTLEEIKAVLPDRSIELAVFRFTEQTIAEAEADEVGQFLEANRDRFFYALKDGGPDSDVAWFELVRELLALVFSVIDVAPTGPFVEERGVL